MTTTAHSLAGPARAPVWCGREVTWLDHRAERLRVARATDGALRPTAAYALDAHPLSALPCRTGWLVATTAGTVHLRRDGRTTPTPWPAAHLLACDPGGRLWLATPDTLLRADLTGRLRAAAAGPTLALTWHPRATVLYRATPTGIDAHPYDLPNGHLGDPVRLADTPATALAVDTAGHLWAAAPDGIRRVDGDRPTIPTPAPSAVASPPTPSASAPRPASNSTRPAPAASRPAVHRVADRHTPDLAVDRPAARQDHGWGCNTRSATAIRRVSPRPDRVPVRRPRPVRHRGRARIGRHSGHEPDVTPGWVR
ncbi:hypothetical protein ACFQV2_32725 [Actinokineospora soli]|uniref:SMP-30/Gluconolaconase/LRE-like region-containing protein n=1 Tax=Actinokineospora soli TaxID=1048753 RepID=A0ABW2TUE4_9PSEU